MTQYGSHQQHYDRPLSPTSNALGLAGFITSVVGILSCGLLSPIGLLLSFIGLFKRPRGFAIAGVIIGLAGSFWIIIAIFVVGAAAIIAAVAAGSGGLEVMMDGYEIKSSIVEYQAKSGSLPADLSQLTGLTPDELTDPWQKPYVYKPDLVNNSYAIISTGPDGIEGNADDIKFEETLTPSLPQTP